MKLVPCNDCLDQFISTRHALHASIQMLQTENRLLKAENARLREKNSDLVAEEIRLRLDRQQPNTLHGWMFKRNADGSIGIFAPPPKPGESQRTSDCIGPSQRDLNELLGKLADHMTAQAQPTAHTLTLGQKLRQGVQRQRQQAISKQEGSAS